MRLSKLWTEYRRKISSYPQERWKHSLSILRSERREKPVRFFSLVKNRMTNGIASHQREKISLFGSWVCSEWISVLLYYIRLRYADLYNTAASFCMARVMFCLMKTSFHISCFDERKYNRYSSYVLGPSVLSGPESFCIYSLSKVNPRCAIRSKGLTRTNMMEEIYLFKERLANTI